MLNKAESLLYEFDLIGITPQLLIFKNKRYKTFFSSILSILIIFISIIFAIVSLNEFLKFESPIIVYSKDNDAKTKRALLLKDTLLIFQLVDSTNLINVNDSIAYYKADYSIMYDNGTFEYGLLEIEKCELGKNINLKYKDIINDKYKFGRDIGSFYCFSLSNDNISLFYQPNIGYSYINLYIIIRNNSYKPERLQSLIVSQNDLIDHQQKDSPINDNFIYQFAGYSSLEFTDINYNFQFIKYESDNGLFYKNSKIINGISYSPMIYLRSYLEDNKMINEIKKANDSFIGKIKFEMNKSNFDNYKRTYPRVQSLLAEVMSVINLLFEIGKQITFILCNKSMSRDVIRNILNKKEKNIILRKKYRNINNFKNNKNNEFSDMKIAKIDLKKSNLSDSSEKNLENKNEISKNILKKKKVYKIDIINKIFDKINYFHNIKSYFCFKDKKTQFIKLCQNTIIEDICVEKILERLYNYEAL